MIVRKIMTDLLRYTKQIAKRIKYYDAIADFSQDSHWYNPFFKENDVLVIWTQDPNSKRKSRYN